MIITETIVINNTKYQRTYSDKGFCVERDGVQYDEAVDPIDSGRTYNETDTPVGTDTEGFYAVEAKTTIMR